MIYVGKSRLEILFFDLIIGPGKKNYTSLKGSSNKMMNCM